MMNRVEFKIDILKQELKYLADKINHFDNLRWKTRQIALALWVGVIGFSLKEVMPILCTLAILLPIPFWIYEAFYRSYYMGFRLRFRAIREFIRDGRYMVLGSYEAKLDTLLGEEGECEFPIPDDWPGKTVPPKMLASHTGFWRNILYPKVSILYLLMMGISGIVLSLLIKKGVSFWSIPIGD